MAAIAEDMATTWLDVYLDNNSGLESILTSGGGGAGARRTKIVAAVPGWLDLVDAQV